MRLIAATVYKRVHGLNQERRVELESFMGDGWIDGLVRMFPLADGSTREGEDSGMVDHEGRTWCVV